MRVARHGVVSGSRGGPSPAIPGFLSLHKFFLLFFHSANCMSEAGIAIGNVYLGDA